MIKDFNERGYLGNQIQEFIDSVERKYSDYFAAVLRINEIAHELIFSFSIHKDNVREIIAASLYMRILNGYQGLIILCQRGLIFDAKVLWRSILEAFFILALIEKDEGFVREYILEDQIVRKRFAKIASNLKIPEDENFQSLQSGIPIILNKLEKDIMEKSIREVNTADIAKRAGLEDIYNTAYRILSSEVHTDARALEYFINTNKKGDLLDLPWNPQEKELDFVLLESSRNVASSIISTVNILKCAADQHITQIKKILDDLTNKYINSKKRK